MKKLIIILSFLGIVSQTFAGGTVSQLILEMPDATPFYILKAAFDSAGPAQINDYPKLIDLGTERSNLKCVSVIIRSIGSQPRPEEALRSVYIGRFSYTVPGTPDNGPLFPGTPGKIMTVLSTQLDVPENTSSLPDDDSVLRIYTSNNYGLPAMSVSASGDLQAVTRSLTEPNEIDTIVYRKNGSELIYHESSSYQIDSFTNGSASGYGYCYPKAN